MSRELTIVDREIEEAATTKDRERNISRMLMDWLGVSGFKCARWAMCHGPAHCASSGRLPSCRAWAARRAEVMAQGWHYRRTGLARVRRLSCWAVLVWDQKFMLWAGPMGFVRMANYTWNDHMQAKGVFFLSRRLSV